MREILFRGWSPQEGKWIFGDLKNAETGSQILIQTKTASKKSYMVWDDSIGEFTGYTDQKGTRIFEGDILKQDDVVHDGKIQIRGPEFTVMMIEGAWVGWNEKEREWGFLENRHKNCKIIGNQYEGLKEGRKQK